MKCRVLRKAEYPVSRWAGGSTTQIYLYPEDGDYGKRQFLFRVSSAVIECPQSDFTSLPGVQRHIMMLQGTAHLQYEGHGEATLAPFQPETFDGGWHTVSQGTGVDFNLMLQQGATGKIFPLQLPWHGAARLDCDGFALAFVPEGGLMLCQGKLLSEGDCLLLEGTGQVELENCSGAPLWLACAQVQLPD